MGKAGGARRLLLPVLVAGLVVWLAGCGEERSATAGERPAPRVTVVDLATERVALKRELPGRTSPYQVAEVRPQVTGIVRERVFTEGGRVVAGEELYRLDDALLAAEHRSALAQVARAEAAAELARLTRRRARELHAVEAMSREELDSAEADLREAEAEVGVAQAAAAATEVRLGYTRISAPIAGRIGKSAVTSGALVTANQADSLATIQQLDPIYVDLAQSSQELLRLRRAIADGSLGGADELEVVVLYEDGGAYPHRGELAFSEVTVDQTTGSVLLRAVVPNPEDLLLPGMFVRAIVPMGVREEALLVPQQAVVRGPSGDTTVMVVGDSGTVERRAVRLGQSVGNRWLVEDGLQAGERVVTEGLQKIQDGMPVDVEPAAAENAR
jgi:membrane fusion protein (multidrug efflux system)